jgi:PAS domain S-box-containing protein
MPRDDRKTIEDLQQQLEAAKERIAVLESGRDDQPDVVKDISDVKLTEQTLRESEEKFRMISEQSLMGIAIIQDDRVVYVNDASADISGFSKEEILEWEPSQFMSAVHPEDVPRLLEAIQSAAIAAIKLGKQPFEGDFQHFTYRSIGLAGKVRWVEQYSKLIQFGGRPAIMNMTLDITERKLLEEMMIQSEKMMSVGELAAGAAHEINNPLAGVLQNAELIGMRLTSDNAGNRRAAEASGITLQQLVDYIDARGIPDRLEDIAEAGKRAAKIVRNMLSFSRKSDLVVADHDLRDLLDQTVELASSEYDPTKDYDFRSIEISRHYDPNVPAVRCEGGKIQQVFLNILKNGAEAMAETSNALGPPRFTLRIRRRGAVAQVEIEDNGPGMSEEVRLRVFEPFFTTKPVGQGTGLGLAVSYFIITNNHQGALTVESTPGHGAKFIIGLPLDA